MNFLSKLVRRAPAVSTFALILLAVSSSAQAVDNVQSAFAGADAGDWGGANGAVIGPPDDACANMGAVGKVNLVSGFDFDIPGDATITGITAFAKAGENGPQSVDVQIATDATIEPPTTVGNALQLAVLGTGGDCASTTEVEIGTTLASWGIGGLTPAQVNSPAFGMVFVKTQASSIKVDSVCMNVAYTTPEGQAIVEDCFEEPPPPDGNQITVVKNLEGAAPGSDWGFTGDLGAFDLPAGGGFEIFPNLLDGSYTITETTKEGYDVSVECLDGETVVASGSDSVTLDLDEADLLDDLSITCIFTNSEILPPAPETRATFNVLKDFTDDNPAYVEVQIDCNSGLILDQDKDIAENDGVQFVVTEFTEGLPTNCTITEDAVPGYSTVYWLNGSSEEYSEEGCTFLDIVDGGDYDCTVVNTPDPVDVVITKEWIIENDGGDAIDPDYHINLRCDGEIEGKSEYDGYWYQTFYGYNTNTTHYTAHVVPDWNGGTHCTLEEDIFDGSVEVDNDCREGEDDSDEGTLVVGFAGAHCTFTNTVFYEGIPTLSQYGMAILALLMLGVGFVGFRRFV